MLSKQIAQLNFHAVRPYHGALGGVSAPWAGLASVPALQAWGQSSGVLVKAGVLVGLEQRVLQIKPGPPCFAHLRSPFPLASRPIPTQPHAFEANRPT
jgi:hypothetical protein